MHVVLHDLDILPISLVYMVSSSIYEQATTVILFEFTFEIESLTRTKSLNLIKLSSFSPLKQSIGRRVLDALSAWWSL